MKKRIVEVLILASFLTIFVITDRDTKEDIKNSIQVVNIKETEVPQEEIINTVMLNTISNDEIQEEIRNEILYGELEELAILVQAEAGNQDELGKRYVADCVLNRVDDPRFPEYIHDIIYQMDPVQFATTVDGAMGKAGYTVDEETFQIVLDEYENRTNSEILYFTSVGYISSKPLFRYGNHYFSK